ncbi:tetrahydrofolate synthase [Maudiozyma exigua]|uniref:C-1-tetrahydrofolate synthase, cytoplasmic n=1 Tax=Maudiozyma exigua TaxID=34358 RepID=A0A9P6WCV1_MAUEX|nr:tetrahydrofolate synthase [Kazachstania exigua]
MTAQLIDGKSVALSIREEIATEIAQIQNDQPDFKPTLAIIQVGKREDSNTYVRMKRKAAVEANIDAQFIHFDNGDTVTEQEILEKIDALNADPQVHGIIVQLPLPKNLDEDKITSAVLATKDVDGFGPFNIGELNKRNGHPHFLPCTPKGIIELLSRYNVELKGANSVVIGRSDIVGGPVAELLKSGNSTVTVLHSYSKDIPKYLKDADIVIVAIGKPGFVRGEWFEGNNKECVVIDVGTNYIEDKTRKSGMRCVGDVEFDEVKKHVKLITHVPGGVGPMTVAMLMQNTLVAAKKTLHQDGPIFSILPLNLETPVPSDYEISRKQKPKEITQIASEAGLLPSEFEPYGSTKGKIKLDILNRLQDKTNGKYILVTGITPTPLGEGKSTTTVGLAQALGAHLNKKVYANVRQPSMGPTFGIKGGAAGGGYSQVIPMDEFNLHVTGDIHAISMANNLLAAAIDTRMFHESTQKDAPLYRRLVPTAKDGSRKFTKSMLRRLEKLGINKTDPNELTEEEISKFARLNIDPETITWRRVVDCNDRFLRGITIGEAPTERGFTRKTGFDISVASECMAILALCNSLEDMRERLGKIVVGANKETGEPVTCEDIGCAGAMTALLKDAIKPNVMQTLEGTPVLVHAGPFANISIGASSVLADKIALKLTGTTADASKELQEKNAGYVITEAGFDFTMGGERFINIKCRSSGLVPDVIIIVATVRALKVHGGGPEVKAGAPLPKEYTVENLDLLRKGCANLVKHIENAKQYNLPVVVAINKMSSDTDKEHDIIREESLKAGASEAIVSNHWEEGGKGAVDLAQGVIRVAHNESNSDFKFLYETDTGLSIEDKITKIAQSMYGAKDVEFLPEAQKKIELYKKQGFSNLPICIAKTQYSLSHDASLKGVPTGFTFPIRDIRIASGANYLYALAAEIQTIPGLPTHCGFMNIEVNDDGEIEGMF